jgi:Uma2 family endonuclease
MFLKKDIVERDGYIHSAPELIVEVLSPGNTPQNMAEKVQDYESIAVPELWVISEEARSVEVLLLEKGKLATVRTVSQGGLTPKLFPGVVVEVPSIWPA